MPTSNAAPPALPEYRTVAVPATASVTERKSEFIAQLAAVQSEEEALAFLAGVKAAHRTARHNVYAYILRADARSRYSDDGEPAKTAGLPVLEVLKGATLADCIMVVTRYFGGTLLGTGGLVRAYTAAAKAALEAATLITMRPCVTLAVTLPYPAYEAARRLLLAAGAQIEEAAFTDTVQFWATLPTGRETAAADGIRELTRGAAVIETGPPRYRASG